MKAFHLDWTPFELEVRRRRIKLATLAYAAGLHRRALERHRRDRLRLDQAIKVARILGLPLSSLYVVVEDDA